MAVGAARPAIRHREPSWRRQQYRHRSRRARAPDGYTLLLVGASHVINATLYPNLSFNFLRDIAPVASITRDASVIVANPSVPARTFRELIAYAKANPGKVNMASAGGGAVSHLSGELLKMMTGINLVHVPYRGAAPALTDLIGGHAQVMFPGIVGSIEYLRAGRLRGSGGHHGDPLGRTTQHPNCGRFRTRL